MTTYSRPGVFIQEVELPQTIALANNGTAIGAFVGSLSQGPTTVPVLVSSWSEFTKVFGSLNDAYPTTWAAYNFFANGGRQLYVKRVVNGAVSATTTLPDAVPNDTLTIKAANPGVWGNSLSVQIKAAGTTSRFNLVVYGAPVISGSATSNILEQYSDLSMVATDPRYAVSVINAASSYIMAVDAGSVSVGAAKNPVVTSSTVPVALTSGTNGDTLVEDDYSGALTAFDPINSPLVFNIPDAAYLYTSTSDGSVLTRVTNIQADVLDYAALRGDAFVVIDTPAGYSPSDAQSFVAAVLAAAPDATGREAAAYYPWVNIPNTLIAIPGATRLQAPGAAMVGQYLATDASVGVFKTPAGYNNRIANAVSTERQLSNSDLDSLNTGTNPVNSIRFVPGNGIVVMGGRTLLNAPGDRYINVRRAMIYLKKQLSDLSAFAIFENNDERLWTHLRIVLSEFLRGYWQSGGLRGGSGDQAFYVQCDSSTTTAADILAGRVNINVGVAIEYPAEFVVISLGQLTGNATA